MRHACWQSKQRGTVDRAATFHHSTALTSTAQSLRLQQPNTWPRQSHQRANDSKCRFSPRLIDFVVDCSAHRPDWFYRLSDCFSIRIFLLNHVRCSVFIHLSIRCCDSCWFVGRFATIRSSMICVKRFIFMTFACNWTHLCL